MPLLRVHQRVRATQRKEELRDREKIHNDIAGLLDAAVPEAI